MERTALVAIALVVSLAPALARAALRLRFEPEVVVLGGPSSTAGIDVYIEGVDAEDEQLYAYDIGFRLRPALPPGPQRAVSFVEPYAEKPADNFVFGDRPVSFAVDPGPPASPGPGFFVLNVEADSPNDLPDVTGPVKVARVLVGVTAPDLASAYYLEFAPELTAFSSGDFDRVDPTIEVDTNDRVAIVFPEPSAAGMMLAGAAVALCRRQRR